ncbi:polymeric immunoglobulin receptor-like isoform X4 [Poeciliopsis prolifica]|uniref:polymeric immunoglobulin receptor-like isoform X4 n=1 Tax=Poeciliopsis prolifica TaxID=188132 RepID=UPI0024135523|nr:polymeric immunoglobulin receptor-like isoform X4 [Poeciliopsis prolifica]
MDDSDSDDRKSRIFTVTISSLTLKDSGSYLCGVQRNSGFDVFTAAELQVEEWCCVESKIIRETAGHEVTLQCPYPPTHRNNRKFLCKGSQRSKCTDMMKGQSRFLLHSDFSGSFSVKITQLEAGDTGTYWCRSEPGWNVGNYTQFQLSVGLPDAALYSLVAVFAGLLLLSVILVTVFKSKCRKVKDVAVVADGKKLDFVEVQETCRGEDVYQNHDSIVMRSQQQHASRHFSDVDEDELDYENITAAEDIYGNESFHKFK